MVNLGLGQFRYSEPREVYPIALEQASAALELDEHSPEAYTSRAWLELSYHFDWRESARLFRRAVELAPAYAGGHQGLSFALQAGGHLDEALSEAEKAFDLDPLMLWTRYAVAEAHYKRRDYSAALEQARVIHDLQPDDGLTAKWIADIYMRMNRFDDALQWTEKAARTTGDNPNMLIQLAQVRAQLGDEEEARKLLERAQARNENQFISPGAIAVVYANLGEPDLAIELLHRAVEEYDSYVFNLLYPEWDPIRSDPRFLELCAQLDMACLVD
jgi:tetratricopeptide (TPR) repeat protein